MRFRCGDIRIYFGEQIEECKQWRQGRKRSNPKPDPKPKPNPKPNPNPNPGTLERLGVPISKIFYAENCNIFDLKKEWGKFLQGIQPGNPNRNPNPDPNPNLTSNQETWPSYISRATVPSRTNNGLWPG